MVPRPPLRQLIIGTHNEMKMEMKVLNQMAGAQGASKIGAKMQRDLALAKHDSAEDKASATIGLSWRSRAMFKNARVRMNALLQVQEDMLIAAVKAIERDAEKKLRDQQAKVKAGKTAAPAERAPVAPVKPAPEGGPTFNKIEEPGGEKGGEK